MSYGTARRWAPKLGPATAGRRRPEPGPRRRLDGMVVRVAGRQMFLWRAVDDEGGVLDVPVQRRPAG